MGAGGGEREHDALGNESELDEAVVCGKFPSDGVAVLAGLAVQVLVAGLSGDGGHGGHPEVVEERADDAFVNAGRERDCDDAQEALSQDAHRLARMAQDIFGLGVRFGLLMQPLDAGHLPAGLADLESVAHQDAPPIGA